MNQKSREWIKKRYEDAKLAYFALMLVYPFGLEDLEGEIWKWTAGYEGIYQISNFGRVKSFPRNTTSKIRIMKPLLSRSGYLYVSLKNKGAVRRFKIHRLVALAFIPNSENKTTVNHKDGIKFNNCVENFEWQTQSENNYHAVNTGLSPTGKNRNTAKLTKEDVKFIRENYKLRDSEFGAVALARRFNVYPVTIRNVIQGKTYKNID